MRFKDIWGKIQVPTPDDDFPYQDFSPKVLKTFGIFCFLCAAASAALLISLGLDIAEHLNDDLTLLNIGIALAIAFMAVGAIVLFALLGERLYQNKSKYGEQLAIATVALVCVSFLAMMLLYGLSWLHVIYLAELVFLAVVTVYMDPELAQERLLSKHAASLDPEARCEFEQKVDDRRPLKGYITLNFFNLFWIFVVCSVLGLAIETVFHLVIFHEYQDRAGLLYGPFSPIYGFGGLLMTVALNRFHDPDHLSRLCGYRRVFRILRQLDHAVCFWHRGVGLLRDVPVDRWTHELHVHVLLGTAWCGVGQAALAHAIVGHQQDSLEMALWAYIDLHGVHDGGCDHDRADHRLLVPARSRTSAAWRARGMDGAAL